MLDGGGKGTYMRVAKSVVTLDMKSVVILDRRPERISNLAK